MNTELSTVSPGHNWTRGLGGKDWERVRLAVPSHSGTEDQPGEGTPWGKKLRPGQNAGAPIREKGREAWTVIEATLRPFRRGLIPGSGKPPMLGRMASLAGSNGHTRSLNYKSKYA